MSIINKINTINSNIIDGKQKIASAITNKGIDTPENATFEVMATNISNIQTGGGGPVEAPFVPYTGESDWPDLTCGDNEVKLLFKDTAVSFMVWPNKQYNTDACCTIDWGDGSPLETVSDPSVISHIYKKGEGTPCSEGYTTYVCTLSGDLKHLSMMQCKIPSMSMLSIPTSTYFNDIYSENHSLLAAEVNNYIYGYHSFSYCKALRVVKVKKLIHEPDMIGANLGSMFYNDSKLRSVFFDLAEGYPLADVTTMFEACASIEYVNFGGLYMPDSASSYNRKSTTSLFHLRTKLRKVENLDLTNATNISSMFNGCENLEEVTGFKWPSHTAKLNTTNLFNNCKKLRTAGYTDFVCPPTAFNYTFANCESIEDEFDMSGLFKSSYTSTYYNSMFLNCKKAKFKNLEESFNSLPNYVTHGITNMFFGTSYPFDKMMDFTNARVEAYVYRFGPIKHAKIHKRYTGDVTSESFGGSGTYLYLPGDRYTQYYNYQGNPIDSIILDTNTGSSSSNSLFGEIPVTIKSIKVGSKYTGNNGFAGSKSPKLGDTLTDLDLDEFYVNNYTPVGLKINGCNIKHLTFLWTGRITKNTDIVVNSNVEKLTLGAYCPSWSDNANFFSGIIGDQYRPSVKVLDLSKYYDLIKIQNYNSTHGLGQVGYTNIERIILNPEVNTKLTTVNIKNCNLNAEALNELFTSLPTPTSTGTITITGNPGADDCDKSIAENKYWTVVTE